MRGSRNSPLPYLALALTCLIWGTTWVASKIGLNTGIHPLYFSGLRQLFAGSVYLLLFASLGKTTWPNKYEWGNILLMSMLLFVLSNGLTTWGLKYITSGLGAIIGATFPLFVAIIDYARGSKDKPNRTSSIGLLLGFAGVAIIFYDHLADFTNTDFITGIILSVIAAFSWAMGTVLTSKGKSGLNKYFALGLQMFVAGVILVAICLIWNFDTPFQAITPAGWGALGYMIFFGSMLAFACFVYMLQHLPTSLASIYGYINPIVTVVVGHFMLNEAWTIPLLIGALVTLAGIYLVNLGFRLQLKARRH